MKNTLRQVFHSPKFVGGFVIFMLLILTMIIYPLINPGNPLEQIGVGTFARPGAYVSLYDSLSTETETMRLPGADEKRLAKSLSDEDRVAMVEWFTAAGVSVDDLDVTDTDAMLDTWFANYDVSMKPKGMTMAKRNYYQRLNNNLLDIRAGDTLIVTTKNDETGELEEKSQVNKTDYVNIGEVANVKVLPLGTDNFGRDVLKQLVSACGTSIRIGLLAGIVATLIGLSLGLLAGYLGGIADDLIMFVTNIFTVIPGFVLLILITNSVGQEQRGATLVAVVIGLTSWTWTARSVRSQVISLRNRDHVNLSKLSGHSMLRIVLTDILPYIQAIFQDPFASFNSFNKIDTVLLDCINMRGGKSLPKEKKVEMMTEACSFVNLKFAELTNKYPFELSGGQMQRLMIARIFLLKPKILLADEPTSMVDACSRATILDMLLQLRDEVGMTIIFITHDIGLAYYISDTVYIMEHGKFVEYGKADEVILNPKAAYTKRLISDVPKIHEEWDLSTVDELKVE